MKKAIAVLLFCLILGTAAQAVTLIPKSDTAPEFALSGTIWMRDVVEYLPDKVVTNQMSIARNYITAKVTAPDYNTNMTLDVINKAGAQTGADYNLYIKSAYIELVKIPYLSDIGMKLRAGIQPMYFGITPIWKYNIYDSPVEGRAGLPSADMGIALTGGALGKMISYEAAMYSGDGYTKLDTDMLKALCADVKVNVIEGLNVILSYYKKSGITVNNTNSANLTMTEAALQYSIGPLIDSYIAVYEAVGTRSAGKTGIRQVVSAYAGYKVFDWLSVHARMDIDNPDTRVTNDELNYYYAGLLIPVADKASLLLDYSLKMKRVQTAADQNDNLFVAQLKWDW